MLAAWQNLTTEDLLKASKAKKQVPQAPIPLGDPFGISTSELPIGQPEYSPLISIVSGRATLLFAG
jgi:hypothetical protein